MIFVNLLFSFVRYHRYHNRPTIRDSESNAMTQRSQFPIIASANNNDISDPSRLARSLGTKSSPSTLLTNWKKSMKMVFVLVCQFSLVLFRTMIK